MQLSEVQKRILVLAAAGYEDQIHVARRGGFGTQTPTVQIGESEDDVAEGTDAEEAIQGLRRAGYIQPVRAAGNDRYAITDEGRRVAEEIRGKESAS